MSDQIRRLYDFELEPEVRDWLESLSDNDFRRVDEVRGLLAEKGSELGGPWPDHLEGPVWDTSSSASSEAGDRPSMTSQPQSRTKMR